MDPNAVRHMKWLIKLVNIKEKKKKTCLHLYLLKRQSYLTHFLWRINLKVITRIYEICPCSPQKFIVSWNFLPHYPCNPSCYHSYHLLIHPITIPIALGRSSDSLFQPPSSSLSAYILFLLLFIFVITILLHYHPLSLLLFPAFKSPRLPSEGLLFPSYLAEQLPMEDLTRRKVLTFSPK